MNLKPGYKFVTLASTVASASDDRMLANLKFSFLHMEVGTLGLCVYVIIAYLSKVETVEQGRQGYPLY